VSEEVQRRFFEHVATGYDSRFLRARWPRNQELKSRVIAEVLGESLARGPVVEIGCGTGQIAAELLKARPALRYVGLDLSASMLQVARSRLAAFGDRVELREVSGRLPLEGVRFACAYGVDVLHHVDDPLRVLGELREGLEPGAPVVFLEGNPRFPITTLIALAQKEERGLFKMSFANLCGWLAAAGFEHVRVEYGPLYTPPGPPRLVPALDRIDRVLAQTPVLRGLAIFFTAQCRAPTS
jgi:SAM-dependent methyltransferase